jgi:hypothetical protein
MDYVGQWGGGGLGHSWALKWQQGKRVPFGPRSVSGQKVVLCNRGHKVNPGPILFCCVGDVLEI